MLEVRIICGNSLLIESVAHNLGCDSVKVNLGYTARVRPSNGLLYAVKHEQILTTTAGLFFVEIHMM